MILPQATPLPGRGVVVTSPDARGNTEADEKEIVSEQKVKMYKLVEIFQSVKGEGTQAGIPMTFVRFSHCNLACTWCDTPYNRVAIQMNGDDLASVILDKNPAWVIFTGGEPCLQLDRSLTDVLKKAGIRMAIETNGMIWTEALNDMDYINISPKLACPIHPKLVDLAKVRANGIDEIRYTICDGQNDLWSPVTGKPLPKDAYFSSDNTSRDVTGIPCKYITISPAMKDTRPRPDQSSGEGFQSMTGEVDQASLNRCLYLVNKYKHQNARLSVQVHKFIGAR